MKTQINNIILEDLQVGDTIYEDSLGMKLESKVETKPVLTGDTWTFNARMENGVVMLYVINKNHRYCAPKIFKK